MANQAKKRKGAIDLSDFDERLLIGSISDMPEKENKSPADKPAPALEQAATNPELEVKKASSTEKLKAAAPGSRGGEESPDPTPVETSGQQAEKKVKALKSWEYSRFLTPTNGAKKSNIYISEINHQKVKSLLSLLGRGVSITDYVENMFESHWEQYGSEIQKRLNENSLFK